MFIPYLTHQYNGNWLKHIPNFSTLLVLWKSGNIWFLELLLHKCVGVGVRVLYPINEFCKNNIENVIIVTGQEHITAFPKCRDGRPFIYFERYSLKWGLL